MAVPASSRSVFMAVLVMAAWAVHGAEPAPATLPDPLNLEFALSLADEPHPDLAEARAALDQAEAERRGVAAEQGVRASLRARARWVEPAERSPVQDHDDHRAGLFINKRLYDFGRTEARLSAADAKYASKEWLYADTQAQRRIAIMEAYFAVIVADLAYVRDNEAMATAFVAMTRRRDRNEQGQVSDIEVLEAEATYQEARRRRYASDVQRRIARAHLANTLNRPGQLVADLAVPDLPIVARQAPEVEDWQRRAKAHNPALHALRQALVAARQGIQAARAARRPVLSGQIEAAEYSRELSSSDRVRAGVSIEVPLYTGGAVDAEVAARRAELRAAEARLARREMAVEQAVLELVQELYVLGAQADEARTLGDFRDLYLDRSRAQYELGVRTDLGDAMVRFSEARLRQVQTRFALALTWAKLQAISGQAVDLAAPAPPQDVPAEAGDTEVPADNAAQPAAADQ